VFPEFLGVVVFEFTVASDYIFTLIVLAFFILLLGVCDVLFVPCIQSSAHIFNLNSGYFLAFSLITQLELNV
jgi:hypothetical protein